MGRRPTITTISQTRSAPVVSSAGNAPLLDGPARGLRALGNQAALLGVEEGRRQTAEELRREAEAKKLQAAKNTDELSNAYLNAQRELNDLQFQTERSSGTDFQGAATSYVQAATEIRDRHAGTVSDEQTRGTFVRRFDRTIEGGRVAVRDSAYGRAKALNQERLTTSLTEMAESIPRSGGDPNGAITDNARKLIADHVRDGWITPAQGAAATNGFDASRDAAVANAIIADDPNAAIRLLKDGETFPALGARERRSLIATAERAVRQGQSESRAQLTKNISIINDAMKKGIELSPGLIEQTQALADAVGAKKVKDQLGTLLAANEFATELTKLAPADAVAKVRELEAKSGPVKGEAVRLAQIGAGRRVVKAMEKALRDDPLQFGVMQKIVQINPLDLNAEPQVWGSERVRDALMVSEHYKVPPRFFTDDEADALVDAIKRADPDQKLAIVSGISRGFGQYAQAALAEIDLKSPVDAHIGALVNVVGVGVGREAYRGQQIMKDKLIAKPKASDVRAAVAKELGTALSGSLSRRQSQIEQTATAIYAAKAYDQGIEDFNEDVFREAVQAASGRSANGRGGIGSWNGRKIILPSEMSNGELTRVLQGFDAAALQRHSFHGGLPVHVTLTGKRIFAEPDELDDAFLITRGDGRYWVSTKDPSKEAAQYWIDSKAGRRYVLDLTDPDKVEQGSARPGAPALQIDVDQGAVP